MACNFALEMCFVFHHFKGLGTINYISLVDNALNKVSVAIVSFKFGCVLIEVLIGIVGCMYSKTDVRYVGMIDRCQS